MRRSLLAVSTMVLVAGVVASIATGSPSSSVAGRWVVRDLGPPGGDSEAVGINERGEVILTVRVGDEHFETRSIFWENGKRRDLGTLGGKYSQAVAINGRGWVIGTSVRGDATRAFLWRNGRMLDLGTFGGPASEPTAINDRGQIVGVADTRRNDADGVPVSRAFLWANGRLRDLGSVDGTGSEAHAINERGQVVGRFGPKTWKARAFLWENGKMRVLGTLGGPRSRALAINDRGQIVGSADTRMEDAYGANVEHAVLWDRGKLVDLGGVADIKDSWAEAINATGQVIGVGLTRGSEQGRALLWKDGRALVLPASETRQISASAINRQGWVAGYGFSESCPNYKDLPRYNAWVAHAYVWVSGAPTRLPTLPGGTVSMATAINDAGQIVGWSTVRSSAKGASTFCEGQPTHAVLWTKRG